MIESLKKLFSLQYDDRPMGDLAYESHSTWIRLLHDYYLRAEHVGHAGEGLEAARKGHVIFISNHAVTLEAALINYFLLKNNAGKVGTLVYKEAFRLPLVRELFRSAQCVPISVEAGASTLRKKHVLLFPEGMDFINSFVNPDRVPRFHKGFLRIAKQYLAESGKKSVKIIPIGHAGVEDTFKFWVVKNETFLNTFIKPFASYPFFVIPKLPFLLPSKVVLNWGSPVTLIKDDLKNERKISQKANHFRATLVALKRRAQKVRGMNGQA